MYVEKSPKTWSVSCISLYVVTVSYLGIRSVPEDTGPWLAVSALFLLLLIPCLGVPISKYMFHRIKVDGETLRVGRETLALADLDVRSICSQRTPSTEPNFNELGGNLRNPRLVGGAWGVPLGMDSVVISTRNGEKLRIATRDPRAFLDALSAAARASMPQN